MTQKKEVNPTKWRLVKDYRIRVSKSFEDGTDFSMEAVGANFELDTILNDLFRTLKSFNAETKK